MKRTLLRLALVAASGTSSLGVLLPACGSGTKQLPSHAGGAGDAGTTDGSPAEDAARDVRRGNDVDTPRDAGAEAGGHMDATVASSGARVYCEALAQAAERCHDLSPACLEAVYDAGLDSARAAYVGECTAAYAPFVSSAYGPAHAECFLSTVPCCALEATCLDAAAAATIAAQPCIAAKLSATPPDPAATKLRADYCASCSDETSGVPACAGFFELAEAGIRDASVPDVGPFAGDMFGGLGFGSFVLDESDSLILAIDTACTGSALLAFDAGAVDDCYERFAICAGATSQAYEAQHAPLVRDAATLAACLPDAGSDAH